MGRAANNLIGQVFGDLTVVDRADNVRGRIRWQCTCSCGRNTVVYGSNLGKSTNSCGCRQNPTGADSHAWRGGQTLDANGYVRLWASNHPNAQSDGRILQHVKVMSDHLGRPLDHHENVHHLNGKRDDNRLENLELWTTSQPCGQRVTDKVAWAKQILRQYEPESLMGEKHGSYSAS